MNEIFKSIYATFVVLIHSKRAWALLLGILTLVLGEFLPAESASKVLAAVGLIAAWIFGETIRPAVLHKSVPVKEEDVKSYE